MGDNRQIHLSRPGGQPEGPFTLDQINRDLAAKKYRDTDYWAWHESLPEWVPLYSLPGVSATATATPPPAATPAPKLATAPLKPPPEAQDVSPAGISMSPTTASPVPKVVTASPKPQAKAQFVSPAAASPAPTTASPPPKAVTAPAPVKELSPADAAAVVAPAPAAVAPEPGAPEPEAEPGAGRSQVSSGMPFAGLEHLFVFTTGEGPTAWQSPTVARMLGEIIGADLGAIRQNIRRDVVGECGIGELLRPDGSISDAVWRAMTAHQPALVQQARDRLYRVCVRTFRIEADAVVAVVLFYNKQKL